MKHASSPRARGRAFTLIELIVATLLAAGIAAASTIAISRAIRAREAGEARQTATMRAAACVDRIALDIQNLVRSGDLYDARVLLVDSGAGALRAQRDELLLFSFSGRRVRSASEQNEGAVYEIQYRLQDPPAPTDTGYTLWRRADPVPDDVPDGGGIASPIVRGVAALSIEAFNGAAWLTNWDSDRDGYPHALRVAALARDDRMPYAEVWLRRTIAIDRTPVLFAAPTDAQGATP